MKDTMKKYENHNIWISCGRLFMCFVVISYHYGTSHNTIIQNYIYNCSPLAVPFFMFVSFFLMQDFLLTMNLEKVKKRLVRLYVPILFWNIVTFLYGNLALNKISGFSENFNQFLMGILFNHIFLIKHMWFVSVQIFILILIMIVFLFCDSKFKKTIALICMVVFAFVLQYSGTNVLLFGNAANEIKNTLGRIAEMIPYATFGLIYAWYIADKKIKYKFMISIFCILLYLAQRLFYIPNIDNFFYGGIDLFIKSACILNILFMLPSNLKFRKVGAWINYIASTTMGIYFVHNLIGFTLDMKFKEILFQGTLLFDLIIFIISFFVSVLIRAINTKLKLKWLEYVA